MLIRRSILAVLVTVVVYVVALRASKWRTEECASDVEEWLANEFALMQSGEGFRTPVRADEIMARFESTVGNRCRKHVRICIEEGVDDNLSGENVGWSQQEGEKRERDVVSTYGDEIEGHRIFYIETRNDHWLNGDCRQAGIRPFGTFHVMRIGFAISREGVRGGHLIIVIESSFFGIPMPEKWSMARRIEKALRGQ